MPITTNAHTNAYKYLCTSLLMHTNTNAYIY